jgi:hypothetical protein
VRSRSSGFLQKHHGFSESARFWQDYNSVMILLILAIIMNISSLSVVIIVINYYY